jgi:hypothetical protein
MIMLRILTIYECLIGLDYDLVFVKLLKPIRGIQYLLYKKWMIRTGSTS